MKNTAQAVISGDWNTFVDGASVRPGARRPPVRSMEDDYGMIDGIINNGPKDDKTADAKSPEKGEKTSIMDRLKSAKAEKPKECCAPQKHKGEIDM